MSTRTGEHNWKYCKVQWTSPDCQVLGDTDREEEVRSDEVVVIDPITDFESIQKVITLSAAVKDENYAKVLRKVSGNA